MGGPRNISIDIAKGIGIMLVVLGHLSGVAGTEPLALSYMKGFVYQFHIPLFFFLSGLFFKPNEGWSVFLRKKINRLYFPFVFANLFFLLVDILLRVVCGKAIIPIDEIKHAVKVVLQLAVTPIGGATWFLIALFRIVILYKLLFLILGKLKFRPAVTVIICFSAALFGAVNKIGYTVSSTMVGLFFFCLGDNTKALVNKLDFSDARFKALMMILALSCLIIIKPNNQVDVSSGLYQNPCLALIGSLSGIILVLTFSSLISKTNVQLLSFVGANSMAILIGHFFSFKIITLLQIFVLNAPITAILSHPCYDVGGVWSVLYLLVGIILPLWAVRLFHPSPSHIN